MHCSACSVKTVENMEELKPSPYFSILGIKLFKIVICFLCEALRCGISLLLLCHGQGGLACYDLWGCKESDTTE